MPTQKISALSTGTTAQAADKIPIERGGDNYYITPAMINTLGGGGGGYTEGCQVRLGSTHSIPDTSQTILTFDTEEFDTDTMHDDVTNNSRITIVTDGLYLFTFTGFWAANSTGRRNVGLYLGGSSLMAFDERTPNASPATTTMLIVAPIACTAGNYFEIKALQTSGGALNLSSARFTAQRIGA